MTNASTVRRCALVVFLLGCVLGGRLLLGRSPAHPSPFPRSPFSCRHLDAPRLLALGLQSRRMRDFCGRVETPWRRAFFEAWPGATTRSAVLPAGGDEAEGRGAWRATYARRLALPRSVCIAADVADELRSRYGEGAAEGRSSAEADSPSPPLSSPPFAPLASALALAASHLAETPSNVLEMRCLRKTLSWLVEWWPKSLTAWRREISDWSSWEERDSCARVLSAMETLGALRHASPGLLRALGVSKAICPGSRIRPTSASIALPPVRQLCAWSDVALRAGADAPSIAQHAFSMEIDW